MAYHYFILNHIWWQGKCPTCTLLTVPFSQTLGAQCTSTQRETSIWADLWWKEECKSTCKVQTSCGWGEREGRCFKTTLWALGRVLCLSWDQQKPLKGSEQSHDMIGHFKQSLGPLAAVWKKDWKEQLWTWATRYHIPDEREWWDSLLTLLWLKKQIPVLPLTYAPQTGFSAHGFCSEQSLQLSLCTGASLGHAEDSKCQNQAIYKDIKSPAPEQAAAPYERGQECNFL